MKTWRTRKTIDRWFDPLLLLGVCLAVSFLFLLWASVGWSDSQACSDTSTMRQCVTTLDDGSTIVTDSSWGLWAGPGLAECIESTSADGGLVVYCPSPGQMTLGDEDPLISTSFVLTDKAVLLELIREAGARGELLMLGEVGPDDNLRPIHFQFDAEGRLKESPCLDRMEAAMRAIEEQFYYKSGGRMIFPFKPDSEPNRQLPGDVTPLIRQWEAVKQECWRNP